MGKLISLDDAIALIESDKIDISDGLLRVGARKNVYEAINHACDRHIYMLKSMSTVEENKQ